MRSAIVESQVPDDFKLHLGRQLFSDPRRDRDNAIVVANHPDTTAGIEAGDLLRIDFTQNTIGEGLYVITLDDDWIGYRFFQRRPNLHMRDDTGTYPVTPKIMQRIKVVGKIKDIYRNTKPAHSAGKNVFCT